MLSTKQLRETVDFYTKVLGFDCPNFVEEWGWAALNFGEVELMFALPNAHLPFDKPTLTGSLYFNVENADEVWEKVKGMTKVCYPIEDFEYGMREFGVFDNNGYLLQFGEVINKNISAEEI